RYSAALDEAFTLADIALGEFDSEGDVSREADVGPGGGVRATHATGSAPSKPGAAEPPTAGYQCMVEGCPAKHVSKREVCGSEANVPANTALLEMRAAFTEAIALLRRWRKRESDCIPAGAGGDYRLFSETG